jgi:hypothetical protein
MSSPKPALTGLTSHLNGEKGFERPGILDASA